MLQLTLLQSTQLFKWGPGVYVGEGTGLGASIPHSQFSFLRSNLAIIFYIVGSFNYFSRSGN